MQEKKQIRLDIFGQICPSCLLQALKALNQNRAAVRSKTAEVLVFTNDRQATTTIPAATTKMGYHCEVTTTDRGYQIRIYS